MRSHVCSLSGNLFDLARPRVSCHRRGWRPAIAARGCVEQRWLSSARCSQAGPARARPRTERGRRNRRQTPRRWGRSGRAPTSLRWCCCCSAVFSYWPRARAPMSDDSGLLPVQCVELLLVSRARDQPTIRRSSVIEITSMCQRSSAALADAVVLLAVGCLLAC